MEKTITDFGKVIKDIMEDGVTIKGIVEEGISIEVERLIKQIMTSN